MKRKTNKNKNGEKKGIQKTTQKIRLVRSDPEDKEVELPVLPMSYTLCTNGFS
jgi:hypothetical protein